MFLHYHSLNVFSRSVARFRFSVSDSASRSKEAHDMTYLFLKSYLLLIAVGIGLRTGGLKRCYEIARNSKMNQVADGLRVPYERICRAIDLACVFYPTTVLCLQRSIAGVAVLRAYGWPAEFVTGCSIGTFEDHAWIEINGTVVNDKAYIHEMYQVLDRC